MLENLLGKAKRTVQKTAVALGLLGTLASYHPQSANADVILSLEPQNGLGFLNHYYTQDTGGFNINIYADNTTEPDPTASLEFKIKLPNCISRFSSFLMSPYLTDYTDFLHGDSPSRDFFYPFPMGQKSNYVYFTGAKRAIDLSSLPQNSTLKGVKQRRGLAGILSLGLKPNTPIGAYQFEITDIVARKSNGEIQPIKGNVVTVNIIKNEDYYDAFPLLSQDLNYVPGIARKVPIIHVSSYNGVIDLLHSRDLITWEKLAETPVSPFGELAFDYVHRDAESLGAGFFKLRAKKQVVPLNR